MIRNHRSGLSSTEVEGIVQGYLSQIEGTGILNISEPASSTETPNPPEANYFVGDDWIYKRINGLWKRWPNTEF
jgi:hypothetical protein